MLQRVAVCCIGNTLFDSSIRNFFGAIDTVALVQSTVAVCCSVLQCAARANELSNFQY